MVDEASLPAEPRAGKKARLSQEEEPEAEKGEKKRTSRGRSPGLDVSGEEKRWETRGGRQAAKEAEGKEDGKDAAGKEGGTEGGDKARDAKESEEGKEGEEGKGGARNSDGSDAEAEEEGEVGRRRVSERKSLEVKVDEEVKEEEEEEEEVVKVVKQKKQRKTRISADEAIIAKGLEEGSMGRAKLLRGAEKEEVVVVEPLPAPKEKGKGKGKEELKEDVKEVKEVKEAVEKVEKVKGKPGRPSKKVLKEREAAAAKEAGTDVDSPATSARSDADLKPPLGGLGGKRRASFREDDATPPRDLEESSVGSERGDPPRGVRAARACVSRGDAQMAEAAASKGEEASSNESETSALCESASPTTGWASVRAGSDAQAVVTHTLLLLLYCSRACS